MSPSEPGPTRPEDRHLSDPLVVMMAVGTWVGALGAVAFPTPAALAALGLAWWRRWPRLVAVAVVLVATARGAASERAFVPVAAGPFDGTVVLLDDPSPFGPGWGSDVRLPDGRRVAATGYGGAGFDLSVLSAGDRVAVSGRLRPLDDRPWTRARHLLGRLDLVDVGQVTGPTGPRAVVEAVRATVARGAAPLPEELRPLYLGLVIGDDRLQPDAQQARFRAAGMSHLLAVSGQNVAFLLAVARPLVRLAGRRGRLALTVVLLVGFAVATRGEPSVLRATVTAGLAARAALGGHRQGGVRLLALAVTGLVVIDPFLVWSVGFQLSVAASAGILVLGPPLAERLPGPGLLRDSLAVTMAAQVAVLPLLLGWFGPVSTASIPANLLAGWAAGAVMTWGLTAGVVAGALPSPLSGLIQLPAVILTAWLDGVAAWAARLPLPLVDRRLALVGAAAAALGVARQRWNRSGSTLEPSRAPVGGRRLLAVVLALVLGAGLAAVPRPPTVPTAMDGGGLWLPGGPDRPSVLVLGPDADDRLLDDLLRRRITALDVVVTVRGGAAAAGLVRSVTGITAVGTVLAPPRHRVVEGVTVRAGLILSTGAALVEVRPDGDRLAVTVTVAPTGDPAGS